MVNKIKNIVRYIRLKFIHVRLFCKYPIRGIDNKNIIIVAPHPDDEALGCSGLIQRTIENGKQVYVVILSGGGKSHQGCCHIDESTLIASRHNLSRKVAEILGLPLSQLYFFTQLYTLLYQRFCIIKVLSLMNCIIQILYFCLILKRYYYGKRYKYFFM